MPGVTICIPWFDTGCQYRRDAFEFATRWWADAGFEISVGAGPSRSAARNDAACRATGDVLVFADADTVVPAQQVVDAAEIVEDGGVVQAFNQLIKLRRGLFPAPNGRTPGYAHRRSVLGVLAIGRALWEKVGGFDERFTVWGGEDRAFVYAAEVLSGHPLQRVNGRAWHIWHPTNAERDSRTDEYRKQIELAIRYKAAAGDQPAAGILRRVPSAKADRQHMLELLREPGAPFTTVESRTEVAQHG